MFLKDHYRVLGLEPSATQAEIRKAYRKLALELHPDKTNGDLYANEKFLAVKEAYEVLGNPSKKEKYLQQRWYYQSTGRKKTASIITPETVLHQCLELDRYIRQLDLHRMDRKGLYDYLLELLNSDTIEKLNRFNDIPINSQVTLILLRCCEPLEPGQEKAVIERLQHLKNNEAAESAIENFTRRRYHIYRWEKYKIWIVLLFVVLLVVLIYILSQ